MPGVSIHVVDVSRGVVAAGMEVELHAVDAGGKLELIAKGRVGQNGLVNEPQLSQTFAAAAATLRFFTSPAFTARRALLCRWCRSSMSSASTSAFPTRRSTTTCRSNARRGVIRAFAAARNPCRAFGARPLPARNRTRV
jgi:hypothetical protein